MKIGIEAGYDKVGELDLLVLMQGSQPLPVSGLPEILQAEFARYCDDCPQNGPRIPESWLCWIAGSDSGHT